MKKSFQVWDIVKEILILTAAIAIITSAVFFFLVPSHTSISSISGLGIILTNFIPLPLSAITMILNVLLLVVEMVMVVLVAGMMVMGAMAEMGMEVVTVMEMTRAQALLHPLLHQQYPRHQ